METYFDKSMCELYDSDYLRIKRTLKSYSFGDYPTCEKMFYQAFMEVDGSVKEIKRLPEYRDIIDWMCNTNGKGLLLSGDCGRGKSTIGYSIIPLLFWHFHKIRIAPVSAENIAKKLKSLMPENDYYDRYSGYVIDDLGVESLANDYGNRFEPAVSLINEAEAKLKILIITTNLTSEQMLDRYGVRVVDRIIRLCQPIKFHGKSLRK